MPKAERLKFPAPYFGGKSAIAHVIWQRLGDVSNFVEPFAGSAAVLLARPHPPKIETLNDPTLMVGNAQRAIHPTIGDPEAVADAYLETINDVDPYLVNTFRALRDAPESVADWADFPVIEDYMHAVHRWLVLGEEAEAFRKRVKADPDFYDPKRAGRWLFGICCWIGSGWCDAGAEWKQRPAISVGQMYNGINAKLPATHRPQLADAYSPGRGVHAGPGLKQQLPSLADTRSPGRGVHAGPRGLSQKMPKIAGWQGGCVPEVCSDPKRREWEGTNPELGTCSERRAWLLDWFGRLRDRLRVVRVCCGHWRRVCDSESVTTRLGVTGLFLDPPYPTHKSDGKESRDASLYASDAAGGLGKLRDEVLAYCRERGPDPTMRIAVAGYDTDGYGALLEHGWTEVAWKSSGGYSNRSNGLEGNINAARERLWFSPGCVPPDDYPLFAGMDDDDE